MRLLLFLPLMFGLCSPTNNAPIYQLIRHQKEQSKDSNQSTANYTIYKKKLTLNKVYKGARAGAPENLKTALSNEQLKTIEAIITHFGLDQNYQQSYSTKKSGIKRSLKLQLIGPKNEIIIAHNNAYQDFSKDEVAKKLSRLQSLLNLLLKKEPTAFEKRATTYLSKK